MLKCLMVAVSIVALTGSAFAQQVAPPNSDQLQAQIEDLNIQVELTGQQLKEANKNFVNERSSTIRIGRQLNQSQADLAKVMSDSAKKDDQVKILKAELETAQKELKASIKPAAPPAGGVDKMPDVAVPPPAPPLANHVDTPVNAGPARP